MDEMKEKMNSLIQELEEIARSRKPTHMCSASDIEDHYNDGYAHGLELAIFRLKEELGLLK